MWFEPLCMQALRWSEGGNPSPGSLFGTYHPLGLRRVLLASAAGSDGQETGCAQMSNTAADKSVPGLARTCSDNTEASGAQDFAGKGQPREKFGDSGVQNRPSCRPSELRAFPPLLLTVP